MSSILQLSQEIQNNSSKRKKKQKLVARDLSQFSSSLSNGGSRGVVRWFKMYFNSFRCCAPILVMEILWWCLRIVWWSKRWCNYNSRVFTLKLNVVSSLLAMILIFYTCVLAMLEVIYSLCRGKEETAVKGKVNAVSKGKGIDVKIADTDEQKEKVIFKGKGKDVKIVDTEEQKEAKRNVLAQLKAEKAMKEQAKKERDAAAAKAKAKKKEDRKKNQKKAQASSSENFEANYIGNLKNL